MKHALQFTQRTLTNGGVALVIGLALFGHAPLWIAAVAISYIAVKMALTWALAPTEKELVDKDRAWLSEINRDYARLRSVEDRLDELERLKRRDMITPEEYAAKRQEILKDL